jgi:hypothetical protein
MLPVLISFSSSVVYQTERTINERAGLLSATMKEATDRGGVRRRTYPDP